MTKATYCITKLRDIVPMMKEAFQEAQSGTPGPVFVELPIDVLYPYPIISKEIIGSASGGRGLTGKVLSWYLHSYLANLFAGAFDQEPDLTPLPVDVPYPSQTEINKAIELITQAKKPLVILGSQSTLPPVGADKLRKAIEVCDGGEFVCFSILILLFWLGPGNSHLPGRNVPWIAWPEFAHQHATSPS